MNVYFSIWFFETDDLKLEIFVLCVEFLAFKYVFIFFSKQIDDYLYLYIRNLEYSRFKPFFGTQCTFVFVLAGREYYMDIVLSKNRY